MPGHITPLYLLKDCTAVTAAARMAMVGFRFLQAVYLGRVAGKVRDDGAGALQAEYLKNGVVGGLVLALDDGVIHAHLLDRPVVGKHRLAARR